MFYPIVSVIIPTYNTEKYITEAIGSVFSQEYRPVEVIVVDDGSTDHTYEVIKQYHATHIRHIPMTEITKMAGDIPLTQRSHEAELIYIYQKNSGRASARNKGIKAATGKYVAFLDSDDLWTLGKLNNQVKIMEANENIDFLFGDKQRFSDRKETIISSMFKKQGYDETFFGHPLYVCNAYKKLLQGNFIPTGTVMMRRKCLEKTGLFDESIYAEDYEFWLRVALFSNMAYSEELWELERDREGSGSKNLKAVYLSNIRTYEKHEKEFSEILIRANVDMNSQICDAYKSTGYFFLKHEKLLARQCFKKSLLRGFKMRTLLYWLSTFLGSSYINTIQRLRNVSS